MPRIRAATIEEHKTITRRQILEAAQRLIADTGSADISLGDVAAEVGIGRTTIYDYFLDRDDLIASLVEETLPDVVSDLFSDLPAGGGPVERLTVLAERMIEFVASDPVLGLILHRELPRLSLAAQERIRVAHRGMAVEMGEIFGQGVALGEFQPMPLDVAAQLIQDVLMAGARVVLKDPDPAGRLPDVKTAVSGFLLSGLRTRR
jgi:AcrR family transcriptional regulator